MDVVCLGILVADVIARPVDGLPRDGSLDVVDEIGLRGGGCALNTASALVKLGLSATIAGKVGADAFGEFILGVADQRGIDRRAVVRDQASSTSATVVLVAPRASRCSCTTPVRTRGFTPRSSTTSSSSQAALCTSEARSSWTDWTASRSRESSPRRRREG